MSSDPSNDPNQDIQVWQAIYNECKEKLETTVNIAMKLLAYEDDDVGLAVTTFLEDYLDLLKARPNSKHSISKLSGKVENCLELTEECIVRLQHLFNILMGKISYPADKTAEEIVSCDPLLCCFGAGPPLLALLFFLGEV